MTNVTNILVELNHVSNECDNIAVSVALLGGQASRNAIVNRPQGNTDGTGNGLAAALGAEQHI